MEGSSSDKHSQEDYVDIGLIKNEQSPIWIQHIGYEDIKYNIIKELLTSYHGMEKIVNSPAMIKYGLNEKSFFVDLLKNMLIMIQCCNQFQLKADDDQSVKINEILQRFFKESINLVSSLINDVRSESKRFLDSFSIDKTHALSHEKVKNELLKHFDRIYEILEPMSCVTVKSSRKNTIAKHILESMISVKPSFKNTFTELLYSEEYEDAIYELARVMTTFIELQTILQKKIEDRHSTEINSAIAKIKTNMAIVKGKHPGFHDKLPVPVLEFLIMITEGPNVDSSKKSSNDDPWSGRMGKRKSPEERD